MQTFAVNTVDNVLSVAKETTNSRTTSSRLPEIQAMLSPSAKRDEEHRNKTRRFSAAWEPLSVEVVVSVLNYGQVRE